MLTSLLSNHYVHIALSLGSIIGGAYSFATALTKRMKYYHAYIRRFLIALIYGLGLGLMSYFFDKRLDFFYERLISSSLPVTLPDITFGVANGLFFFLLIAAAPIAREDERINPRLMLFLYSLVTGLGSAVFLPVGAIFLISRYHWFGWSLNGIAILVIVLAGFIWGTFIGYYAGSPMAQGDADGAQSRGCVLQVIGSLLGIPSFIAFGQLMGWGPFLLFMGLSLVIGIVLYLLNILVEVLPSWVLTVLGIILVVVFALIRGYEAIANSL